MGNFRFIGNSGDWHNLIKAVNDTSRYTLIEAIEESKLQEATDENGFIDNELLYANKAMDDLASASLDSLRKQVLALILKNNRSLYNNTGWLNVDELGVYQINLNTHICKFC